jgi:outer membrane usher protein
VPGLRAFDVNHIAIDPTDVPLHATLNNATREVRPQDRSGVIVGFAVKMSHGALLRLVDAAGAPIAVGSSAKLTATGAAYPVGYEGEVYLEDLAAHNELVVEGVAGQRCALVFDYVALAGDIPTLGPLVCRGQRP